MRTGRVILVVAFLVSCSSSSSSVSSDAAGVAAERPADSNGGARDASADVDGDCTQANSFTCVASCASATPTPLICDDGHWECESGVDSRQCGGAGT